MQQVIVLLILVFFGIGNVGEAFARSQDCGALSRKITLLENNTDFKNRQKNHAMARAALREIKKWERVFVRSDCKTLEKRGKRLSRTCRTLGHKINRLKADYTAIVNRLKKGEQLASARQAIVQHYQKSDCSRPKTNIAIASGSPQRMTLFERLFGGAIISNDRFFDRQRQTYRTVCARLCDGFYWPVSYSTLKDSVHKDAAVCRAHSDNGQNTLYYFENDGGSPETMIDLNGVRYADTETAFRYRTEYDASCAMRPDSTLGSIKAAAGNDRSRAVITFGDVRFPLPRVDPRRAAATKIVEARYIALPPPRPGRNSKKIADVTKMYTNANLRTVFAGGRSIRIVGPDTPYVPKEATGS